MAQNVFPPIRRFDVRNCFFFSPIRRFDERKTKENVCQWLNNGRNVSVQPARAGNWWTALTGAGSVCGNETTNFFVLLTSMCGWSTMHLFAVLVVLIMFQKIFWKFNFFGKLNRSVHVDRAWKYFSLVDLSSHSVVFYCGKPRIRRTGSVMVSFSPVNNDRPLLLQLKIILSNKLTDTQNCRFIAVIF